MHRALLSVTLGALLVASCGSDDGKRKVRADEGGAGGGESAGAPNAGGSLAMLGGQGGEAPAQAGQGGVAETPSGGAPSGGVPGSAGSPGSSGEAGAPAVDPVSPTCGAGQYDAGEGGCQACVEPAETVEIACLDYYMPNVVADGAPGRIDLSPFPNVREPLAGTVDVTFVTPNQTTSYPLDFALGPYRWQIPLTAPPADPAEIIVEPFTTVGACGDLYESTERIRFVRIAPDDYAVTCPDQT